MTPDAEATLSRARQYLKEADIYVDERQFAGDAIISDLLSLVEKQRRETLEEAAKVCDEGVKWEPNFPPNTQRVSEETARLLAKAIRALGQTVNAAAQVPDTVRVGEVGSEEPGSDSRNYSDERLRQSKPDCSNPAAAAPSKWIDDGAKLRELRYAFESVVAYAQKNDLTMRPDFDYLLALLDCAINAFLPVAAPSQPNLTERADLTAVPKDSS